MRRAALIITAFTGMLSIQAFAQVPTITGDNMLCPEGTGVLTTESFDTYQWYRRYFGSQTTELLPGETNQTLTMDAYNFGASYMSVEVTLGGVSQMSDEYFVDGYAFMPPSVAHTGDYEYSSSEGFLICEGDTMFLELMPPYTANISWTNNGNVIPGATSSIFAITESGYYDVMGAPAECPNYIVSLGFPIQATVIDCESPAGLDDLQVSPAVIFPNPASGNITVSHPTAMIQSIEIHDASGKLLQVVPVSQLSAAIPLNNLGSGMYFFTIRYGSFSETQMVSIQ